MIKFFLKRVPVLSVIVGIAAFFLDKFSPAAFAAVILGSAMAMYKLILWNRAFKASNLNSGRGMGVSVIFAFTLLLTLSLLTVLALLNIRLFFCFSAGYLTLPAFVVINALTEGLRITKNNWGDRD